MPPKIAVLRESAAGERRVALDPGAVERLVKLGCTVNLQSQAGASAGFPDQLYSAAEIVETAAQATKSADVVLKVMPPSASEVPLLKKGMVLICFMHPHRNHELVGQLADAGINTFAMELIPRISRAQAMDALSSQATVSGYKAALIAAELSPRLFPMLTTAAGTIRPSQVVVIGAGVAGLQAIATSRRLGAQVEAYDIRSAAKEQVESLGAKLIDTGVSAEGTGGYARELSDEEKQRQSDVLALHIASAHAVISTASVPGRPAPKIITRAMVEAMPSGAVVIDLAAENGGNCELTVPGETIHHGDKIVHGPLNLASSAPVHASEMYARNIINLLNLMIEDNELSMKYEDDIVAGCMLTHAGSVTHAATREQMGIAAIDPEVSPDAAPMEAELPDVATADNASGVNFLEAPDGKSDNLKKISGVGPKMEQTLNEAGIYHYWQIAELDQAGIEFLDAELNFKGRIQRDNWVGQADALKGSA
jgi:NAD(P) transhydrogenase subunit alpha